MSYYIDSLLIHSSSKLTKQLIMAMVVIFLVFVLLSPNLVSAYAGLGGYISEKLLGSSGGTSASLYLGDSSDGPVVLGTIPLISTLAATNTIMDTTGTTATLRGNLANLNGMPQADVWFVWGYTPTTMTNTTPSVTVFAIGDQTATITGFDPQEVFYQFKAGTDGTAFGVTMSFVLSGGRGTAFFLMWNILTLVIAFGLFILVLRMSRNPLAALTGAIVAIIAITLVRGMLQPMF